MTVKRGFTLIELLIVIAIMGVLAMGVLVGINPLDRINAANDSNAQSAVNQISGATEAYAVTHNGVYPVAADASALQTALVTSGDLKSTVAMPSGWTLTGSSAVGSANLHVTLKSNRYVKAVPSTPFWSWCSSSGKTGPTTTVALCP